MAVNPMQRKSRNAFLLGMLLTLVITGLIIGFLIWHTTELQKTIATKEAKTVCVLRTDIKSGGTIDPSMIQTIKTSYAPANALTAGDVAAGNLKVKTDLTTGVTLSTDMVYAEGEEINKDLRVQEYNMLNLPAGLKTGSYIDIRLTLTSGQDYIVISKKEVLNCDANTIWINMSEHEILTMNNAIIEHYIMTGSNLYATIYVEPGLQAEATPTYSVSTAVNETMSTDPNILQTAIDALNQRSAEDVQKNRQSIDRDLSQYASDKKQNIEENVEESREATKESRLLYLDELSLY